MVCQSPTTHKCNTTIEQAATLDLISHQINMWPPLIGTPPRVIASAVQRRDNDEQPLCSCIKRSSNNLWCTFDPASNEHQTIFKTTLMYFWYRVKVTLIHFWSPTKRVLSAITLLSQEFGNQNFNKLGKIYLMVYLLHYRLMKGEWHTIFWVSS